MSLTLGLILDVSIVRSSPLTEEQEEVLKEKEVIWNSNKFEGDMILPVDIRNGINGKRYRWRNRVVPYVLAPHFSAGDARIIHETVKVFAQKTCLTVRPKLPTDVDYIYVTGYAQGCFAAVGRNGGPQTLNLQPNGCIKRGTIIHEFMHAIGFQHQQSNWNRDNYVTVLWQNIKPDLRYNFRKLSRFQVNDYGFPYDYGSIMHYHEEAFSVINGLKTIVPKDKTWMGKLGLGQDMSSIDVMKVKAMYNC